MIFRKAKSANAMGLEQCSQLLAYAVESVGLARLTLYQPFDRYS